MRLPFLLIPLLLLCQCGAPRPPVCQSLPIGSRAPAREILANAQASWNILADPRRKTEWPAAEDSYNAAVRILFDKLRCGPGGISERAQAIGTALSTPGQTNEDLGEVDAIFPASEVKIRSQERYNSTPGLGVPAVAWIATSPVGEPRPRFHPPNGWSRNVTAVLDFGTPVPQWHFPKRWIKESYQVAATDHRLAADWTAPIDFFWYMSNLDELRIENLILPARFTEETGLYFLRPYDPGKIPLVMVHGLASSPDAYRFIINDLSPEPWFRDNYQVWLYNYPTGTPWLYSAMKFRQNMKQAVEYARSKGYGTKLEEMVVLSHSMGGLLTRTAITDPGNELYDAYFKTPFDQLGVKSETRELIREGLLYEPFTIPERVVFMAVPQRGSPMATSRGTGLLSKLIRLPKSLTVGLLDATLHSIQDNIKGDVPLSEVRPPTSISSLSPHSPGFEGLERMPLPDDMAFHSIIGDKGHGDTPDSSDGVVPYWSSHIEGVESELIVPSDHSVPSHPATAKEIRRILLLHLEKENILSPDERQPGRATRPAR